MGAGAKVRKKQLKSQESKPQLELELSPPAALYSRFVRTVDSFHPQVKQSVILELFHSTQLGPQPRIRMLTDAVHNIAPFRTFN